MPNQVECQMKNGTTTLSTVRMMTSTSHLVATPRSVRAVFRFQLCTDLVYTKRQDPGGRGWAVRIVVSALRFTSSRFVCLRGERRTRLGLRRDSTKRACLPWTHLCYCTETFTLVEWVTVPLVAVTATT